MGAVGGLLGLGGGTGGTGFTPNSGVNQQQINTAYTGTQNSLADQQALLRALQGQNGIGNQTSVFNQLQGVANGTGPNPAQAMLNQATGQNVANQAALMAGQRGAGANVGLMARQAAMQGANTQQQAIGQGATLQANQSLNALGSMGNMANTMAGQQIGQTQANTAAQMGEQQQLLGANTAANTQGTTLANTTQQGQQGLLGGALGGVGAALSFLAGGGQVGAVSPGAYVAPTATGTGSTGPQSMFAKFLTGTSNADQMPANSGASSLQKGMTQLGTGIGQFFNQKNPNSGLTAGQQQFNNMTETVSPETLPATGDFSNVATGGSVGGKLKAGGNVPGQAKVKGDSLQNDNVKAMLSPGEIVIPRSVTMSKDPVKGSADFVRAVLAKKRIKAS